VRALQATTDHYYTPPPLPRRLETLLRRYERRSARRRYVGGVYGFRAAPPFEPCLLRSAPLLLPEDETPPQRLPRLSPLNARVVFPGGAAVLQNRDWLVSYGVHDERCAIRRFDHAHLVQGGG